MARLYMLRPLRRLVVGIFSRVNPGDIRIKHHHTGEPFLLHSYKHKNYWFHGKNRERVEMQMIAKLVQTGDTIIEVGAHIGYLTLYFAHLAGNEGHVIAFEPVPNNVHYLEKNTVANQQITVERKAASKQSGIMTLHMDTLSGMTSTLVGTEQFSQGNVDYAFGQLQYQPIEVEVVKLDDYLSEAHLKPNFIKIDAEGAEYDILLGLEKTLERAKPILFVEITRQIEEVDLLLERFGYQRYSANGQVFGEPHKNVENSFCLHPVAHADLFKDDIFIRERI